MAQTFYDKRTRDYCSSAHPSVTSLCNSSNSPGELEQLLTCTRARLEPARLWQPPCCCSGDTTAVGAHTGHQERTQSLPSHTGNVVLEKSHRVQPVTLRLKVGYFSITFTCLLSYLPTSKEIVRSYFQP